MDGTEIQIGQSEALNAPRRLTSILITDICEFSRLAENDEASAIRLTDVLYALFESTTERHGGRVFKRIADGFLAEFPSAQSAMAVALEFLEEVKARNNLAPNAIKAEIRAALHVGDVTDRADGDIMGHGVNIASRLQELAEPGTILASSNIMNLLGRDFPYKGVKRGNLALKNISEPVTAFQIDPDKDGGFQWPTLPAFLRSRNLAYLLIGAAVLFGALTLQAQRQERLLDEKLDRIMVQSFDNQSSVSNGVSAPYIRNVLENLHRSNIPSHQASFALLEEGNIPMAIQRLEDSLDGMEHGSAASFETMHQIAALSLHYDPQKSASYYEIILEINPEDKGALDQIVYVYNLTSRPERAVETYLTIKDRQNLSVEQKLRSVMDMAFSQSMTGNYNAAGMLLRAIETDVEMEGLEREYSRWLIESAILNERIDDLEKAESQLLSGIIIQNDIGTDSNYSRAQNVLGMIYLKRADNDSLARSTWLEKAEFHFSEQLANEKNIEKKNGQAEAFFYLGIISSEFEDYPMAKQRFIKGLRIAKEHKSFNMEFAILIQLSNIEVQQNTGKQCDYVKSAHRIYEQHIKSNIGPRTASLIEQASCDFIFVKLD